MKNILVSKEEIKGGTEKCIQCSINSIEEKIKTKKEE